MTHQYTTSDLRTGNPLLLSNIGKKKKQIPTEVKQLKEIIFCFYFLKKHILFSNTTFIVMVCLGLK